MRVTTPTLEAGDANLPPTNPFGSSPAACRIRRVERHNPSTNIPDHDAHETALRRRCLRTPRDGTHPPFHALTGHESRRPARPPGMRRRHLAAAESFVPAAVAYSDATPQNGHRTDTPNARVTAGLHQHGTGRPAADAVDAPQGRGLRICGTTRSGPVRPRTSTR